MTRVSSGKEIPVMKPLAVNAESLSRRIQSIASAGIFSNRGPQVRELETRLGRWLGVSPTMVVAVCNATVGLSAAITLSQSEGWNVPAWSFPATALAPMQAGKPIRFVDVGPQTWLPESNFDQGPHSFGTISAIPFGASFDHTVWRRSGEHVIDAAASLSSRPQLGGIPRSVTVVFSLHATKTMGGAEGGIVVFGDEERAREARQWINFGFSAERESVLVGTNGKMSEYDAAVANARLDGWFDEEKLWADRRAWANDASKALGIDGYPDTMQALGPYWIGVFPSRQARDAARISLSNSGIDTRLWWGAGLHRMPAFSDVPLAKVDFVEDIVERYVGLPFFPSMTRQDFDRVSKSVDAAMG